MRDNFLNASSFCETRKKSVLEASIFDVVLNGETHIVERDQNGVDHQQGRDLHGVGEELYLSLSGMHEEREPELLSSGHLDSVLEHEDSPFGSGVIILGVDPARNIPPKYPPGQFFNSLYESRGNQKECTCKDGLGPYTCTTILITSIQVMWLRSRPDHEVQSFGYDRMCMLIR